MSKKQIQITMAFLAFVASLHASSGRRGFGQVTANLKAQSEQLSNEAEQTAAERAFLDKRKSIMREEEQSRLSMEHEQEQESDQNDQHFNAERNKISTLDNAGDKMFSTLDEEDQAYNQMMDDFHSEKAAIEKKEAKIEKIKVRLVDGSFLDVRKDVLELSSLLKKLLFNGEYNSNVLKIPEKVNPEAARAIFTFLESLLTPGAKKPDLFKKAPTQDDLLEFMKINKDIFNTLNFLDLMPKRDLPMLVSPGHRSYDYMSKGYPMKENAILYHQNDSITPEIAKIFIKEDMESVQKFSDSGDGEYVVKSHEDIQFMHNMTDEIINEFSKIIVLRSPDFGYELTEDELLFLMNDGYSIIIDKDVGLWANKKETKNEDGSLKENQKVVPIVSNLDRILLKYAAIPDCALKNMIKEAALNESKIYFYDITKLDGLPEDMYQHLLGGAARVRIDHDVSAYTSNLSEGKTQGEKILNDRILKGLEEIDPSKPVIVSTLAGLKSLSKLPKQLKSKFTFDFFKEFKENEILNALAIDQYHQKTDPNVKGEVMRLLHAFVADNVALSVENFTLNVSKASFQIANGSYSREFSNEDREFILKILSKASVLKGKKVYLEILNKSNNTTALIVEILKKIKGLQEIQLSVDTSDDIKRMLPYIPGSIEKLTVKDHYLNEDDSLRVPGSKVKLEDEVVKKIEALSQYRGQKEFIATFRGLYNVNSSGYNPPYEQYSLTKLIERVSKFKSSTFSIKLNQYQSRY